MMHVPPNSGRAARRTPWYLAAKAGPLGAPISFGLLALGLFVLVVTWYRASGTVYLPEQVAYLSSGGTIGLAFVGVGLGMLITTASRDDSAHMQALLQSILAAVERMAAAAEPEGGACATLVSRVGSTAHVPGCVVVDAAMTGAADLLVVDAGTSCALEPCGVCQPWPASILA